MLLYSHKEQDLKYGTNSALILEKQKNILKKTKGSSAYDAELQSKTSSVKIHALSALNHRRKFENGHVQRVTLEKNKIYIWENLMWSTVYGVPLLLEQMKR